MAARNLLIAGNWKMNGTHAFTCTLLESLRKTVAACKNEIAVFPPYTALSLAKEILKNTEIKLGAQDVSAHEVGAYTGEIAASMLLDAGCHYVIVGHSERRTYHHESNEIILKKCFIAQQHQLTPILCLGETEAEKEAGVTQQVITQQLAWLLQSPALAHCVLAYEPVWAIGTGKTASPFEAQAVHQFIRQQIAQKDSSLAGKIRILYGGSVKADNAAELFSMPDIDGGLIGGASLKAEEFSHLCQIAKA